MKEFQDITRLFHYNEPKRNVVIAYKILEGEKPDIYKIQYASSIYVKEKSKAWIKKNHIITAINRLIIRPLFVNVTLENIVDDDFKSFMRSMIFKHGSCSNERVFESKIERRGRINMFNCEFNILKPNLEKTKEIKKRNSSEIDFVDNTITSSTSGPAEPLENSNKSKGKQVKRSKTSTINKRMGFVGDSPNPKKRISNIKKIIKFFDKKENILKKEILVN